MYAQAGKIGMTTNIEAKTRVIQEAVKYCYSQNLLIVSIEIN